MKLLKVQHNPVILDAIMWESNEPEIREFVGNDGNLKFRDRGLEVWNAYTQTWENCQVFSYIVKDIRGHLSVVSPEEFKSNYSIVE